MSGGARRVVRKLAGAAAGPIGEQIAEVAQGLQVLSHSLEGFVTALNPAVTENFNTAMKELSATVGESLLPAFQIFSGVIRQVADQIAPAMQALAEPIAQLAQTIGGELIVGARLFAATIQALAPIFKTLVNAFDVAIKETTKGLLLFTAYLLKAIGATKTLEGLVNAFAPDAGGRRAAAGGTPAIKDLQQIGKDLALASANAQGNAQEKNDDFIPKIYELLKDAKDNGKTLEKFLEEQFNKLVTAIKESVPRPGQVLDATKAAIERAPDAFRKDPVKETILTLAPVLSLLG